MEQARPYPVNPTEQRVYLTVSGLPIMKDIVEKTIQRPAKRTDITRLHPHLFPHSFAVRYLVNGGEVFTLQKILEYASLDMTRKFVTLASADVKEKHILFSPIDYLGLAAGAAGPSRKLHGLPPAAQAKIIAWIAKRLGVLHYTANQFSLGFFLKK